MRRCRSLLVVEMVKQFKQLEAMRKLRTKMEDPKTMKTQRAGFKRLLSELEESSWYSIVDNRLGGTKTMFKYNLVNLRIVDFNRNSKDMQQANIHSYVRALTRGSVGSSSETVVEQPLSILKKQNKENLDWRRLLIRLQFQSLGPLKHEENALKEKLMKRMKADSAIRATVKDPTRRKTRSPHIRNSLVVDRVWKLKQRYRGFC